MSSSFGHETAVLADPVVPGRFTATLSEDWRAPVYPNGGITAALAARAMQQLFDQPLRSVHTLFVSPVPPGSVTVDVTVLRRGRTVSQASATLTTATGVGLVATAAFGADRPGFDFADVEIPRRAPVEHCRSVDEMALAEGIELPPMWRQLDARLAHGHSPRDPEPRWSSEQTYWYRFRQPPRDEHGVLDPVALLVLADTMAGAIGERLGSEAGRWLAPTAEMTVRLLEPARGEWILSRARAHRSRDGYISLENELWDPATGTLAAHATQLAFFSFPTP
ncbi:thioesterase family protein [Nocardia noduli]|uniref:thioesterase family protein n=1 Tax=Nocardia noduli TaxID=2815722 RepID=UPI001C239F25|nr:thioesterase family protein [Nocardia noduli]